MLSSAQILQLGPNVSLGYRPVAAWLFVNDYILYVVLVILLLCSSSSSFVPSPDWLWIGRFWSAHSLSSLWKILQQLNNLAACRFIGGMHLSYALLAKQPALCFCISFLLPCCCNKEFVRHWARSCPDKQWHRAQYVALQWVLDHQNPLNNVQRMHG